MSNVLHADPTFNAAVAMEVREKKGCGVCTRRIDLMSSYLCCVNKTYPRCRRERKGFDYDEGCDD